MGVVSAGVVGMILHLAWTLAHDTLRDAGGHWDGPGLGVLIASIALLRWARWPSLAVVMLAGALGLLRWGWGG